MADFEKEFADLLSDDISAVVEDDNDIFGEPEASTDETFVGIQNTLGGDFDMTAATNTDVDMVLCIDVTASMQPIIDTVKEMALSLYDDVIAALAKKRRKVNEFRVKVIAFRDYYCDGQFAMAESQFFSLPNETAAFSEYVLGLKADGGGDEPENALEAIALAMKSDWVHAISANEKARNIILVFTDASAHPFEKAQDGVTRFYPDNMLTSLADLRRAWEGQNQLDRTSLIDDYMMDQSAKRLIIYSPQDSYPWNEIGNLRGAKMVPIESEKGGQELNRQILLDDIAGSIQGGKESERIF